MAGKWVSDVSILIISCHNTRLDWHICLSVNMHVFTTKFWFDKIFILRKGLKEIKEAEFRYSTPSRSNTTC